MHSVVVINLDAHCGDKLYQYNCTVKFKLRMKQPDNSKNDTGLHRLLDSYTYNNLLCYTEDIVYVTTDKLYNKSYDYQLCVCTELNFTFIRSTQLKPRTIESTLHYTAYHQVVSINILYDKPEFFSDPAMINSCRHIQITYNDTAYVKTIDLYTFYDDTRLYYMLHQLWYNYYTYVALQSMYDHADVTSLNSTGQYTLYNYLETMLCNTSTDFRSKTMCCDELCIAVACNRHIKKLSLHSSRLITHIINELHQHKHIRLLCTNEYITSNMESITNVQIDCLTYIVSLIQLLNRMLVGSEHLTSRMNIIHTTSSTQSIDELLDDILLLGTNQSNSSLLHTIIQRSGIIDDDYTFDINNLYTLIEKFDITMAELMNNLLSLCQYSTLTHTVTTISIDILISRLTHPSNTLLVNQYLIDLVNRICHLLQVDRQPALSYYIYCCINILHELCQHSIPICTYIKLNCIPIIQQYILSKAQYNNMLPNINETGLFYYTQSKIKLNSLLSTIGLTNTSNVQ